MSVKIMINRCWHGLFLCLVLAGLVGCSATPYTNQLLQQPEADLPARAEIPAVGFFPQTENQCGAAALTTILTFSGIDVTPEQLEPRVYVPGRKGAFQVELVAASRQLGRIAYADTLPLTALLELISEEQPVLVLQNLGLDWYPRWHYAVVVGYDLEREEITLRSGDIENYTISMQLFERTWARAGYWGLLVLEPGQLPVAGIKPLPYFQALATLEAARADLDTLPAWQAGVARWADDVELGMGYANALYQQQALDQAARQYANVIHSHPDFGPARNNLAQVLMAQGYYREALRLIDAAIQADKDRPSVYSGIYRETRDEIMTHLSRSHSGSAATNLSVPPQDEATFVY